MVRYVKIFLVLCIGFWGLLGTLGNLSDVQGVYDTVSAVASMSSVPEGAGPPWRTTSAVVIWAGVCLIVVGKLTALLGGGLGGAMMLRHARGSREEFARAKTWAVAGCGATFGLLILSFTIIAEGAFFMFFSPQYGGAGELAFRLAGSFGLITLFVAQAEPG
ncbi:MAG: DUF2165 family protein [Woeseiaceae bacterium]|nr:DUF2165 family protein [Woeseiaceae bacterium]